MPMNAIAFRFAALCACTLAIFAPAFAVESVKTVHPARELVLAERVFQPSGGDDTAPLQSAVDEVWKAGGGTIFLPVGRYRIDGAVTLRRGVVLRGDYSAAKPFASSLFEIRGGAGDEEAAPAFLLEAGSGIMGFTFFYPDQTFPDPKPYPWTVRSAPAGRAGNNQTLEDCTFVNSWKGVCIGPESNECHTFRRITMCALSVGMFVDMTTDIGRVSDMTIAPEVWARSGAPGAPAAPALSAWLKSSGAVAADFARSDWEYVWKLKVSGYAVGARFRRGAQFGMNGVMARSVIRDCDIAIKADALNDVGLGCYDCRFLKNGSCLVEGPNFDSVVQFHSCDLGGGAVSLSDRGSVNFSRCASLPGQIAGNGRVLREEGDAPAAEKERIRPDRPEWPRPRAGGFVSVAEFGASPDAADNSSAFEKAFAAAKARHAGTVYVPAGYYRFSGGIEVPPGIELRGSADVPHHTMSGGSVLMVTAGKGSEEGRPFCLLGAGAGLKGLSFWYPEQPEIAPVPYPWCVRSLGRGCYLANVNIGNAWLGVDFASHPADGHRVSYLSGGFYRCGLKVGPSRTAGWVEDVQFNPHYMLRRAHRMPFVYGEAPADGKKFDQQLFMREHLQGLVFRDCADERIVGTFLFAAKEGIVFEGKTRAEVLIHGTDTGAKCAVSRLAKGGRVRMALGQFVPLGAPWVEGGAVLDEADEGESLFSCIQVWPMNPVLVNKGRGTGRIDQFNSRRGSVVGDPERTVGRLGRIYK